jgi:uroporphyrinogen-III synthase
MPILQDKRILITRTRHQASELATQLEALGAVPILIPTIEIVPPETYSTLDAALVQIETLGGNAFDWLLFTSANAVEVFYQRREYLGQLQSPGAPRSDSQTRLSATRESSFPRIAVIGPATAKAVQGIGLTVDLIPPQYVAESLAEALIPDAPGKRILLIRATDARDILPEALAAAGATVTIADAYRNQIPADSIVALRRLFDSPANYPDAITFTSASTARNLVALLDAAGVALPNSVALISIGPITTRALRDLGLEPGIEAAEPTLPALVEAVENYFNLPRDFSAEA